MPTSSNLKLLEDLVSHPRTRLVFMDAFLRARARAARARARARRRAGCRPGVSPTSVIPFGNLPLFWGVVFGKPFLLYHRSADGFGEAHGEPFTHSPRL